MKNRSHTPRSGEIFHIAIRVKSLRYAPLSIADLGNLATVVKITSNSYDESRITIALLDTIAETADLDVFSTQSVISLAEICCAG